MPSKRRLRAAGLVLAGALAAASPGLLLPPSAHGSVAAPTASSVRAGEWWLSKLDITRAWSVTKGRGVKVAVIDSGVQASHPDLGDAVVGGTDVSGKGNASGTKGVSVPGGYLPQHGTTMAGFIAARGHGKNLGLIGVAPEASLLTISSSLNDQQIDTAVHWAVAHGAKVINMSFVTAGVTAQLTAAMAYAQAHDVVLVAGTGNEGASTVEIPAGYLGVLAVSGVDANLKPDPLANYAAPNLSDDSTDSIGGTGVAGPFGTTAGKQDMPSIVPTTFSPSTYTGTAGTSNATAIVSGFAALVRAAHPDMKAADVVNLLIRTASLGRAREWSPQLGFGVPDAYAAVTTTLPSVCEDPLGSVTSRSAFGIWKSLAAKTKYVPSCTTTPSSSASSAASSGSSAATSPPASAASSLPPNASSSDSSGPPAFVWVLIVVGVLLVAGLLFVLVRRRGGHGGPGGPPGGPGGPGGPPSGGYGGGNPGPWQGPPQGPPPGYGRPGGAPR